MFDANNLWNLFNGSNDDANDGRSAWDPDENEEDAWDDGTDPESGGNGADGFDGGDTLTVEEDVEGDDEDLDGLLSRFDLGSHPDDEADIPDDLDDDLDDLDDLDNIGDADDYHNRSCDLARKSKFKEAAAVCEAGLKKYPNNVDLIADLISYHSKAGNLQEAHRYLDLQMRNIPRSSWNWRSYSFSIDALLAEDVHANEALLRELLADYQSSLPHVERAYLAEHDFEQALGNDANAINALEKAIRIHPAAESCCLRLADYLIERGEFKKSREIAMRGIAASAQSQPAIRTSYCALLICLCDDALLWLDHAAGKPVAAADVQRIKDEYAALDKFNTNLLPYRDQIEDRKTLLDFLLTALPKEEPGTNAE